MGIVRGTVLGLTGVLGALIEQSFGVAGNAVMSLTGIGPLPPFASWILGCFLGVVAGDMATALMGKNVNLGRWAGIKKGLIVSFVAGLGLYLSTTGLTAEWLGPPLADTELATPRQAMRIGSIWLGAVLGDLFDA